MGCKMKREYKFWSNNSKKILLAVLISMMWISTLAPMVLAINTKINCTFDPNGSVSLDVWPRNCAFGVVFPGATNSKKSPTQHTIWNNGSISMTVTFQTNATADSAGMTNYEGAGPVTSNQFALNTTGLTADTPYIPHTAASSSRQTVVPGTPISFYMRVTIGSPLTTNYTSQRVEVRLVGTTI